VETVGQTNQGVELTGKSAGQRFATEGLKPMGRPNAATLFFMGIVSWAERLNLRYAADGTPPVFDTAAFPWARDIEKEWHLIRAELEKVLVRREDLPGFHEIAADVSTISTDRGWKSYLLCAYGHVSGRNTQQCAETWRIVQKIPGLKAAMFSIFEPGKHLPAHRGPYNGVLRLHLGLIVPPQPDKIAIRVDARICHWEEGKVLIFDDAYEHEAWNHSDAVRVVLFVDFVRPTRFPARLTNWLMLNLAVFTPFVREGYENQKRWEKLFYGKAVPQR
jgi:aspartyl/asparaginyl beta-hydroxylase (cupin superfamily)